MILDTISEKVGEKSQELSMNMTTVLLGAIDHTRKEIAEKKSTIVTLTTKNDEINKKVASTYDKLNELDVSADMTSAAITDLTNKRNQLSSHIDDLEEVAEDAIGEAGSIIDSIESEIGISSLTPEEKAAILAMLNDSRDGLGSIQSSLVSTSNLTTSDITGLNTAILNVEADINGAKEKLNNAAAAKTDSLSNLDNVKSLINDMLSSIAIVQSSMNSIESKIGAISVTDPSSIVSPVATTIKPVVAETTHLNYIFPVLVVLVLMFTGILLSTTLIMLEKKTTAYFRNFISPTKDITFITSIFVTCFILLFIQVIVILGISAIFFGPQIFYSLGKAAPILLFCISLFTLVGMLVGYMFSSSETATLGAISVGSVMLLLSDVILPLESMPQYVLNIAQYNPFVLGSSLLRKAIIHNVPFTSIENGIALLFGYCAVIFVLVIAIQSVTKKHYISKFLKNIAAKPNEEKEKKADNNNK
jgi:ABC-type multidrug transport system permease subunit